MNEIKIENFKIGQEEEIHQLIKNVYDEFVSGDYTDAGNDFFYEWIHPARIAERQKVQNNLWVATDGSKIVGMIEIRDNKYISLLFVNKDFHGRGIARRLYEESLKICIQRNETLEKFYVHASPFSIPIYEKLGFIATDEMQEQFGIKYLPMEMRIDK
jgi:GNAT superfamily N-acetyltransferase